MVVISRVCPTFGFTNETEPKPKPLIPRKELKGEIDIWNANQLHQMQFLFERK